MFCLEDLVEKGKENLIQNLKLTKPLLTRDAGIIEEKLTFQDCNFQEIRLYGNVFSEEVVFRKCQINLFQLVSCSFNGELKFHECEFLNQFSFDSCNFEQLVSFRMNNFHNGINLFSTQDEGCGYVEFNGGLMVYS